jgi:SM-20-related protein
MDNLFEAAADGLASQSFAVVDQFLSQTEVQAIIALPDFVAHAPAFKKAGIGNRQSVQVREEIRGDYIRWLDAATAPPPVAVYLQRLQELRQYLNRSLFLSLKDAEIHLTVYPPGTFYKRHLDQFRKDDHRKLSAICYLNFHWRTEEGGQLRLYLQEQERDVLPEAGRLVIFRSDVLEHEVLPATRPRLSITGWMLDREAV